MKLRVPETQLHVILECEAFSDLRDHMEETLKEHWGEKRSLYEQETPMNRMLILLGKKMWPDEPAHDRLHRDVTVKDFMQAVDRRRQDRYFQNPLCARACKESDFTLETALKWGLEWYAENESARRGLREA